MRNSNAKRLLKEMNALAKLQQNYIISQGQDLGKCIWEYEFNEIEEARENIEATKKNVEKSERELTEANHYTQLLVKSE